MYHEKHLWKINVQDLISITHFYFLLLFTYINNIRTFIHQLVSVNKNKVKQLLFVFLKSSFNCIDQSDNE
jgi:hypothetical protein